MCKLACKLVVGVNCHVKYMYFAMYFDGEFSL